MKFVRLKILNGTMLLDIEIIKALRYSDAGELVIDWNDGKDRWKFSGDTASMMWKKLSAILIRPPKT